MAPPPIVALEIGTSKIIALVGEIREHGNIMVTGMGEHPSVGVRKGEIVDLENAVTCVRAVLQAAEESGRVAIRQVLLAVSDGHVESLVNRGAVPVLDPDGEITEDDIQQVMEVAGAVNLPTDRDILHTICQHFCIDDQERVVKPEGNPRAQAVINRIFETEDTEWRGLGTIPKSGYRLRPEWAEFDAFARFGIPEMHAPEPEGCLCGEVLKGMALPRDCALFGRSCTPQNPVGPCMVSSEGSCAAEFKYGRDK